jgi:hypothetical protein
LYPQTTLFSKLLTLYLKNFSVKNIFQPKVRPPFHLSNWQDSHFQIVDYWQIIGDKAVTPTQKGRSHFWKRPLNFWLPGQDSNLRQGG